LQEKYSGRRVELWRQYISQAAASGGWRNISLINGVQSTMVGYANGRAATPTYEEVCHNNTGHAETIEVVYNPQIVSLEFLLNLYFDVIDPTAVNMQCGDIGTQYRTGIYYTDKKDLPIIKNIITEVQEKYIKPIATKLKQLENFYPAEEYHRKYLNKNPNGYC